MPPAPQDKAEPWRCSRLWPAQPPPALDLPGETASGRGKRAPALCPGGTATVDAFGRCRTETERLALRAAGAAAAGATRPSGQRGAQEIFFLSAGKGGRGDPHPGLGADAGQQPSPASFREGGQSRLPSLGSEESQEESQGSAPYLRRTRSASPLPLGM